MRSIVAGLVAAVLWLGGSLRAQDETHTPQLLLTGKLLRRLQRDRERQTPRWVNFEKRVQSVADSPERGFELALYYAVSGDGNRGRDAVAWALKHPCNRRQALLVADWCRGLLSDVDLAKLTHPSCPAPSSSIAILRDDAFAAAVNGTESGANVPLPATLEAQVLSSPADLYALCEYLVTVRASQHTDLRKQDARFFSALPKELLLSTRPERLNEPDWMLHIAALALVGVDPNLEGSQFLQGWALEDRQMLRDGPGVAYEFLWADPYLPGIAFDNLDPWVYDPSGRLFARSDWTAGACWIALTQSGLTEENCPATFPNPANFGSLHLLTMNSPCLEVAAERKNNEYIMVWKLKPHQAMTYEHERQRSEGEADMVGLWPVPIDTAGKVCVARGR